MHWLNGCVSLLWVNVNAWSYHSCKLPECGPQSVADFQSPVSGNIPLKRSIRQIATTLQMGPNTLQTSAWSIWMGRIFAAERCWRKSSQRSTYKDLATGPLERGRDDQWQLGEDRDKNDGLTIGRYLVLWSRDNSCRVVNKYCLTEMTDFESTTAEDNYIYLTLHTGFAQWKDTCSLGREIMMLSFEHYPVLKDEKPPFVRPL